jgi:hypothetical protein
MCPYSILGLNKSISSPHFIGEYAFTKPHAPIQRKARSDDWYSNNDSATGNDNTGFTFMQLGVVKYANEDRWKANEKTHKEPTELNWESTGYVLVVEINNDGRAGAVWMLCNFHCIDPNNELRFRPAEVHNNWGVLSGEEDEEERRAGFKIANHISELMVDHKWLMAEVMEAGYMFVPILYEAERGD